jgi:hypothetical protein
MGNQKLTQAEISQLMATYESELRKLEFQRETVLEVISKLQKHTGIIELAVEPVQETPPKERKKPGPKAGFKKTVAASTEVSTSVPNEETAATVEEKPKKGRGKGKQKATATDSITTPAAELSKPAKISAGKGKQKKKTEPVETTPASPAKRKGKLKLDEPIEATPAVEKPVKAKKEKAVITAESESKAKPGPKTSYNKWDHFIFDLIKKVGKPMTSADIIDSMKAERDIAKDSLGDTALSQQLNRTLTKLGGKLDLLKKEPYSGKGKIYSLKDPNAKLPA